ncbi:MAG: type I-U CRISPR-associated helicase/endonuclease Cas3 [Anaerolineae bacterium]|nr:type I-U CRISPR-associated helicase/endonuclease Cas3 [Anaerolineae bacterium]
MLVVLSELAQRFNELTGHPPLRWQTRLLQRMLNGELPELCDLPTGLGKTAVIVIWLLALYGQLASGKQVMLPRRLIYIVNRRTVVDQATNIVLKVKERIQRADTPMTRALRDVLGDLAVSTLRGELADNEEWKADPSRPAIIIGTVDMIGSKLLFRGYGDSYRLRAHHAGLLGQDALIIHDEAHLTPAFGELLFSIRQQQRRCGDLRPIHVMELSATALRSSVQANFNLTDEDLEDEFVARRLRAGKHLRLHAVKDKDGVVEKILDLALRHKSNPCKAIIFVESPEEVTRIAKDLKKKLGSEGFVSVLTGTLRGHERDKLLTEDPVVRALLDPAQKVDKAMYLVANAAGEVGVDFDADHMVGELTTLDRLIQRLGRVNRSGRPGYVANIDIVYSEDVAKEQSAAGQGAETGDDEQTGKGAKKGSSPLQSTLEVLQRHAQSQGYVDVSPKELRAILDAAPREAFSPQPRMVPITDLVLDSLTLTSLEKLPYRPDIADYLHGIAPDPPETHVIFRVEVPYLTELSPEQVGEWFDALPVRSPERLRDTTERIRKQLIKIAKRLKGRKCVLISADGDIEIVELSEQIQEQALRYATIVLPAEAGGLTPEGLLDGDDETPVQDLAERDGQNRRFLLERIAEGDEVPTWIARSLIDGQVFELDGASPRPAAGQLARQLGLTVTQLLELGDPAEEGEATDLPSRCLLLLSNAKGKSGLPREEAGDLDPPTIEEHSDLVTAWVRRFAERLQLDPVLGDALAMAAHWHDSGKDRDVWQRAIFNNDSTKRFAKSGPRGMKSERLGGYRHEFGSLLDAVRDSALTSHPEADLILHLIAAHHGWARPHFRANAMDYERYRDEDNAQTAFETLRRFERLQRRCGRWGLAWLESLLRSADALASRSVKPAE